MSSVVLGSSDPDSLYLPGETVTLTVHVSSDGTVSDNAVTGSLNLDFSQLTPGVRSQSALPVGSWVLGTFAPGNCNGTLGRCVLFSQVLASLPSPTTLDTTNFHIATATFTIDPDVLPGTVLDFIWATTPPSQALDFFGVTNAPGYSVTVVPEPTTAALLCVGLLVLAARRRA